jgi:hypothetical protein
LKNSITKEKQSLGIKGRGCHNSCLFIKENASLLSTSFSKECMALSLQIKLFNQKNNQFKKFAIKEKGNLGMKRRGCHNGLLLIKEKASLLLKHLLERTLYEGM